MKKATTPSADYTYRGGYLKERGVGNYNDTRVVNLTYENSTYLDGYDAWGRVVWMRNHMVSGGGDIAKFGYGYSYASNRNYQEDLATSTQSELYGYDNLHRLTSFKRGTLNVNKDDITGTPVREQTWALDDLGNWENSPSTALAIDTNDNGNPGTPSDARTHSDANEISTIDPEGAVAEFDVIHDAAGNLHILPDRTDLAKAQRFTYDYRNRLISVDATTTYDEEEPAWTAVARYFYDGLNRRIAKNFLTTGNSVLYLYNGWQVVEERVREDDQDPWVLARQFIYGGRYIDEPLIFDKDTDSDGDCTDTGGSDRYFYAQQANFNVVGVAKDDGDGAATVVETITYDPYGEATVTIAQGQAASDNPYLFQGRRYDTETGLYYFRNRYYSAQLGRFMQRDPMGYVDGMGLYEFVASNPCNSLDYSGLSKWNRETIVDSFEGTDILPSADFTWKFGWRCTQTGAQIEQVTVTKYNVEGLDYFGVVPIIGLQRRTFVDVYSVISTHSCEEGEGGGKAELDIDFFVTTVRQYVVQLGITVGFLPLTIGDPVVLV